MSLAAPTTLGQSLRAIRAARRLSLADVAAATEISPSFLSLVENGKSDITIGRLVRLAEFYNVTFSDLLPAAESTDPDIVREAERRLLHSPVEGIDFQLLTTGSQRMMMPMLVSFEPDAHLAEHGRHVGEEFIHVIEGTLSLELEGQPPRTLSAGDSAYYSAERPHLFRNASTDTPLRLICVDCPPNI